MSDQQQKERAPELTKDVDRKLDEIDHKLDGIDNTLADVKSDLRAWRKALVKFYAGQNAREEEDDGKR